MSHKKPDSIIPSKQPNICPVCGKASYSAAGIHPQCSFVKADQERAEEIKKRAQKAAEKSKIAIKKNNVSRWQKSCPKCKSSLHVRKKECDCGYTFKND